MENKRFSRLDATGADVAETTAPTQEGVPPASETAGGVAATGDLHLHAEVGKLRAALEKEKLKNAGRATASRSKGSGGCCGSRPS